ncbi:MAG: ScyD/ScyE family protein [Acidobacteriota bacterium]|nr:ScyD/ScyE family protein [Acidobacteriota bacterium]
MNKSTLRFLASVRLSLTLVAATVLLAGAQANAQVICPVTELTSGLRLPLGITQSNQNNLLVSETGTTALHSGRISIVDLDGNRRTLLDGLPSGINDVNEPSGPAGLFLRGRTLYVAIGVGDVALIGRNSMGQPIPGTAVPNPNGPSSPIFSSILAVHFSANVEKRTGGFTLSFADQQALAAGERVRLSNGGGDKITIELVANFPDFTPNPLPFFPPNVRVSNPFDLVAVGNQLYVTDGGMNLIWQVDISTGAFSTLATFPPIPNPLFGTIGGPVVEAVPTGIADSDGQLLVTLFLGFPFPPNVSVVEQVDPQTGDHAPLITGLKTAIDVLPIKEGGDTDYLVLQHTSGVGPPFVPPFLRPGLLLHFETPDGPPTVIANCLNRPTSMTLDEKTGTLYVTEFAGRLVAIPVE